MHPFWTLSTTIEKGKAKTRTEKKNVENLKIIVSIHRYWTKTSALSILLIEGMMKDFMLIAAWLITVGSQGNMTLDWLLIATSVSQSISAVLWYVCCAVLCCAVLCCAVLCCAVLCCAVLSLPTCDDCENWPTEIHHPSVEHHNHYVSVIYTWMNE